MMEQWLIEGNFTQKEALNLSCDILSAGIDTVIFGVLTLTLKKC